MTTDFIRRFRTFSDEQRLLSQDARVLVAVSGGADSIALLTLLLDAASDLNLTLAVAHLNHGIRGKSSDRDERFVRKLAESHQLPFFSSHENVPAHARNEHLSLEEAARNVRYRFLESVRSSNGFDSIALGHHAGDKAETVLINLVRGTGIRGLRGIRPRNGNLIRPLLFAERGEIESFLRERGQKWMTDSTNRDVRYLRNRIRRTFLQPMETIRPGTISAIGRAADALAEIDEFLRAEAERVRPQVSRRLSSNEIILDIIPFLRYFKAVRKAIIFRILEEFDCRIHYPDVSAILELAQHGRSGAEWAIESIRVIRSGETLVFYRPHPAFDPIPILPNAHVELPFGLGSLDSAVIGNRFREAFNTDPLVECFDLDRMGKSMTIRTFRAGDRFVPFGMKGKKKLQDFFVDEHVPNYRRENIPILVSDDEILWVIGYRMDDRYKLTPKTKRVLRINYNPQK